MLKVTNLQKHAMIFIPAWLLGAVHRLVWVAYPKSRETFYFWWFMVIAGIMFCFKVEIGQALSAVPKKQKDQTIKEYLKLAWEVYWSKKWLDTLADLAVGITFLILGLLPWWVL